MYLWQHPLDSPWYVVQQLHGFWGRFPVCRHEEGTVTGWAQTVCLPLLEGLEDGLPLMRGEETLQAVLHLVISMHVASLAVVKPAASSPVISTRISIRVIRGYQQCAKAQQWWSLQC